MTRSHGWAGRIGSVAVALVAGTIAAGGSGPSLTVGGDAAETGATASPVEGSWDRPLDVRHTDVANVRLVLLTASVEDRRGRPVKGLGREDFRVYEDHVEQRIEHFGIDAEVPLSVAFLLDVSGSMRQLGKLEAAKEAIREVTGSLRPRDRVSLVCFADEQVAWVTDFTSDRARFLERLAVQHAYGQTALHDAVARAPAMVAATEGDHDAAILLVTDGVDNKSLLSREAALETARRARVPIYAIGFTSLPRFAGPKGEIVYDLEVMRAYAEESGGALFVVRNAKELRRSVRRIEKDLRYRYLIGYHPARKVWDGGYRKVRLETANRRLTVRSRKGYYAMP